MSNMRTMGCRARLDLSHTSNVITGRNLIAYAINSGEYPVLEIDSDAIDKKNDDYVRIGKVNVICTYKGGEFKKPSTFVRVKGENGYEFHINSAGACIKSDFGLEDIIEMVENSKAPTVRANQNVVVVSHSRKLHLAVVMMLKTGPVNSNCMTVTELTGVSDDEMEDIVEKAKLWLDR